MKKEYRYKFRDNSDCYFDATLNVKKNRKAVRDYKLRHAPTPPARNGSRDVTEHVTIQFAVCHLQPSSEIFSRWPTSRACPYLESTASHQNLTLSIDAHLLQEQSCHISPRSYLKRQSLGLC